MGDGWYEGMKEGRQALRSERFERNTRLVLESGVPFESKNRGHHLIFRNGLLRVDYWPAGGLFQVKGKAVRPGGPAAVFRALGVEPKR